MGKIVVGVAGSAELDQGLLWALRRAARTRSTVEAVLAWEPHVYAADPASGAVAVLASSLEDAARERLDASISSAVDAVPGAAPLVSARLECGPAAAVLERVSREAELTVVTARHITPTSRFLHGSVTSALLHHASCPVVVLPPAGTKELPGRGRVLVGADETPASQYAIDWAVEEANERGLPLIPVYVGDTVDLSHSIDELDADLLLQLKSAAPGAKDVQPRVVRGSAGPELVRMAEPTDVIVVGSRGRGELAGWLLGSTSSHVVRHAPCPVIVVREQPA